MTKLRVALIGTGGIANAHIKSYLKIPEVEIIAGSDLVPGKAREFLDRYECTKANAYESTEEMLKKEKPDAVSVCTYNSTHAECTVMALEAGCHVLLEKPMCITMEQAQAIMDTEKRTGKIVTIGFQPRYDPNMQKIREIVQSGDLGRIYYVQTGGGRRRGMPGGTFIDKELAGVGALADIGCYGLDMPMNALGYPKPLTVSASAFDFFGKSPLYNPDNYEKFSVDDFCVAMIRLEGGITLDFRISWAMHMDTTGATFFLGDKAGLKVEPTNFGHGWDGAWDGTCGPITVFHDKYGRMTNTPVPLVENKHNNFEKKVEAFVDAVINNKPAPIPTNQIIYNQAIISGIIESVKLGREVEVKLP